MPTARRMGEAEFSDASSAAACETGELVDGIGSLSWIRAEEDVVGLEVVALIDERVFEIAEEAEGDGF